MIKRVLRLLEILLRVIAGDAFVDANRAAA
jgi:hypothetical protein